MRKQSIAIFLALAAPLLASAQGDAKKETVIIVPPGEKMMIAEGYDLRFHGLQTPGEYRVQFTLGGTTYQVKELTIKRETRYENTLFLGDISLQTQIPINKK